MKAHKFNVGDKVRRSRRWWPKCSNVYTILSRDFGKDNNDRPKLGYRLADEDWTNGVPYLEIELEAAE